MTASMTRRNLLTTAGAMAFSGAIMNNLFAANAEIKPAANASEPFGYCLNTSTISGANLGLSEMIDIAGKAKFGAVEPWLRDIEKFIKAGGVLGDLAKKIEDYGMVIPSAIGFAKWIVDDEQQRTAGIEQMKHDMDLVAQLKGTRIAAPPIGANGGKDAKPELANIVERYKVLLDLGRKMGVKPELEVWGSSKTLNNLGDAVHVIINAADADACMLLDVFHLYKGGSSIAGLKLLNASALGVLHTNDYPADPPREKINDQDRIYPGDGVAPLKELFITLKQIGWRGYLSVELFNREYWKQSPQKVAQAAIDKTRAAVQSALG